jgi:hypothetical protein
VGHQAWCIDAKVLTPRLAGPHLRQRLGRLPVRVDLEELPHQSFEGDGEESRIAEGDNQSTIAEVIDAYGQLLREIGQQVVAVAYQLDNLMSLVQTTTQSDGSG